MVRYWPSIFPNSDLDEEAVVWACAYWQRRATAQRKLRDAAFGALFALSGIAFTVVALFTQIEPSGAQAIGAIGYVLAGGGLVVLLGGIILIVYAWATDRGAVAGLLKAYWRLIALPCPQGAVLVWDTLGTAQASIVMFDVDAEKLGDLVKNIPADFSDKAEGHRFLLAMKQVLDSLKQIQVQAYPAAFFPMATAPGQSLAALFAGTSLAPPTFGKDHFILPAAVDQDIGNLESFAEKVSEFLEGSELEALEAVRVSVTSQSQQAVQALSALAKGLIEAPEEFKKGAGARAGIKHDLSEGLDQLFTPVLNELGVEVKVRLGDLKTGTDESIKQIKSDYERQVHQLQSERDDRLRSLDLDIQQCTIRIDEVNRSLNEVNDEARAQIGLDSVENAIGLTEAQIKTLEAPGNPGTTESSSSTEQLRELRSREQMLLALQTRLLAARADLKNAQDHFQQLEAERDGVTKEFEQRVQGCLGQRDAEIKNREADHEKLAQETGQHIREIQADKEKLAGLLQQALDDLSPLQPAALPESPGRRSAAPFTSPAAAEAILEYRTRAMESLRDETIRVVDGLVGQWQRTAQFVRGYCWESGSAEEAPGEYLIPIWFVRYERQRRWRPFLSVCDLAARAIRPGEQLGLRIDETPSRILLEYMSRQMWSDYSDGVLSSAFAPYRADAKERLLGELHKMQRWNLIGPDLFEGIRARFDKIDKFSARTPSPNQNSQK